MPYCRIGPVKLEKEDRMRAATERVQKSTALAALKKRRKWHRASTARKMMAIVRLDENVAVARKNVTQEADDTRNGQ